VEVSAKRYRYAGKEKDEETGLAYFGARYDAPWLGRWISADPAGLVDGTNRYAFVRNNPINRIDPTGMAAAAAAPLPSPVPVEPPRPVRPPLRLVPLPPPAAAPAGAVAGEAAIAGPFLIQWALAAAAMYLAIREHMRRGGSMARYGNPYGMPAEDIAFPLQRYMRDRAPQREPERGPADEPAPSPQPTPKPEEKKKEKKLGRIYVTYTKFNERTHLYYSGRTSAVIDLNKPLRPQAEAAVQARDENHHINIDENEEPKDAGFQAAVPDKYAVGKAVNYARRYSDVAYLQIRGREQQLIDYHGGAQSDTRPGPKRTENAIRGVAKDHRLGKVFHAAATLKFGRLHRYTGD
jgi:RHS repeat-associated protein